MNDNSKELDEVRKLMRERFREMGVSMNGSMGMALTRLIEATDEVTLGENFKHAQITAQRTYMQYMAMASALAEAKDQVADAMKEAKRYQEEFRKDMETMKTSDGIEDPRARAAYQLYMMIVKQADFVEDPGLRKVIYQSGSYAVWAFLTTAPMPSMNDGTTDDKPPAFEDRKPWKKY